MNTAYFYNVSKLSIILLRKMSTVSSAKAALRAEVTDILGTLTANDKAEQSRLVFDKLVALPAFKAAKRISTFLSLANEIDTEPIVRRAFAEGKQVFVPRYNKQGMEMVRLESMEDWETLPVTSWGIKQPRFKDVRENALTTGLDLVIVPGVAFTASGHRLGHGGGYYDRFLETLRKINNPSPQFVAVAFKQQIFPEIPTTERDVIVDTVLYKE